MSSNELILVTGASGFIASHIIVQLLEKGYKVRGTVRNLNDEKKISHLKKLVEDSNNKLELCEANLLDEECWTKAISGCTVVMHTASPFPHVLPNDIETELIKPAVNGTLNVLKACAEPSSRVRRVVLTSSIYAIHGESIQNKEYSENDWADTCRTKAYAKSKAMAEKAAWDFIEKHKNEDVPCFELVVINPGYVLGPILHNSECTSMVTIKKLLERRLFMVPNTSFATCDVRDVAAAHIRAMEVPEAVNYRHIIASTVDSNTIREYAVILDNEFRSKGYRVPTLTAPNFFVRLLALFDKSIRLIVPFLGAKYKVDNSRMRNILKIEPIDLKKTIIDMANDMILKGLITKS